jgi:hypothetical protein
MMPLVPCWCSIFYALQRHAKCLESGSHPWSSFHNLMNSQLLLRCGWVLEESEDIAMKNLKERSIESLGKWNDESVLARDGNCHQFHYFRIPPHCKYFNFKIHIWTQKDYKIQYQYLEISRLAIVCCDFLLLIDVNEWINNGCAACVRASSTVHSSQVYSFTSIERRKLH